MGVVYRWRYDAAYYRTAIDRYYRQLPFTLHLPMQFTVLWLVLVGICWGITDLPLSELAPWALLIGVVAIPTLVAVTKQGIFLRYRIRPDGMLLIRRGAIRWLPDQALESGSCDEATALVRSKLPVRVIQ